MPTLELYSDPDGPGLTLGTAKLSQLLLMLLPCTRVVHGYVGALIYAAYLAPLPHNQSNVQCEQAILCHELFMHGQIAGGQTEQHTPHLQLVLRYCACASLLLPHLTTLPEKHAR